MFLSLKQFRHCRVFDPAAVLTKRGCRLMPYAMSYPIYNEKSVQRPMTTKIESANNTIFKGIELYSFLGKCSLKSARS